MTEVVDKFLSELDLSGPKLAHFGVKGMRWGVRRSRDVLARAHANSPTESVDAVRARETLHSIKKSGSLSAVSDADLRHLLNRMDVEKKFSEAQSWDKTVKKRNDQIKTLLDAGESLNTAMKFYHSPAGHLLASKVGLPKPSGFGRHALGGSAGKHAK